MKQVFAALTALLLLCTMTACGESLNLLVLGQICRMV